VTHERGSGSPPKIGPYRILSRVGAGGTAVVFKAEHETSGQIVALKTVTEPRTGRLASLRREIQMLGRIGHKGVVKIFDGGSFEGRPWCAMELIDGWPLARLVAERRSQASGTAPSPSYTTETTETGESTPPASASGVERSSVHSERGYPPAPRSSDAGSLAHFLTLVRMLCSPLAYLHGEGIVHRDIKPSNVFIRTDGTPVIMDFGIAWLLREQEGRESLVFDAARAGTVSYMAPEQARGERVDARADLFSLGCIMYEAITGQVPFHDRTRRERAELDARDLVRPSALALGISPALDELVIRLLSPSPRERVGYASDIASVLAAEGAADWPHADDPQARVYLYRASISGRAAVATDIGARIDRLVAGRGSRSIISGESGIGKTTVASEIARVADARGLRVITGECAAWTLEAGQGRRSGGPLYPFRKVLQNVADIILSSGGDTYGRLLGQRAKILAICEPSLRQLEGASALPEPAELPAEATGQRLVEAFLDTLAALGRDRPTLVVLDDLQWADDLSLSMLANAPSSFFANSGVMVLATARSEDLGSDLERLLTNDDVLHVKLGRLDDAAIGAMAADMMGQKEVPAALISFLERESQGNPFFAAEYVRAAVDAGILHRDGRGRWQYDLGSSDLSKLALPQSIQELVRRRLEALPDDAQQLLQLAALIGRDFNPDILAAVVRVLDLVSEARLLALLADLTRRQIFEEMPSGSLRFTHDRLRAGAELRVADQRRTELHKHIGRALETWHTREGTLDRVYGQLAHHFDRGRELAKALEYSDLAGAQAHRTHATHEALWHLERAKQIEEELGVRPSAVDGARRERMLGLSSLDVGNVKSALAHLIEATRLVGNPWPSTKVRATGRMFNLLFRELGRRFLGLGADSEPNPGKPEEREALLEAARAYERLAVVNYYATGDKNAVALAALGNTDLAERAGGPSAERCLGYASLGTMCSLVSLDKAALYYVSRARAVAREAGDRAAETWALINIALVHVQAGRWQEVREADEAARVLAKEIGFKRRWVEGTMQLSTACFLEGDFAEAARLNDEAADAVDATDQQARVWRATRRGESMLISNEAAGALQSALEGVKACEGLGRPEWIYALGALALAYLRTQDFARAREAADRCAAWIGKDTPIAYYNIEAYAWVAEVYFALLERATGSEERDLRVTVAKAVRQVRAIGRVMRAGAPRAELWTGVEALRLGGDSRKAERHFRKSIAAAKGLHMAYDEALGLAALATHLPLSAGEAEDCRDQAKRTFSRLGAAYDLARLQTS
jgi:serine/threonine protein kinase